ncbi:putative LMBR1-like membrane protein [Monocercomonoides exilis]|uniref:putative LMBR1-like membrane protein n=1 Tax=Monocercomonoides exilis TaxID=2049356 RepID=UPI00355A31A7|nr:putative LMBR1-like membrane protein [Monocercomonoides exilis]|eukprot:MONOS_10710.1-p1 / transcript=MONOS_10710.1 / gene=MONOS_10710 / organism=Monocercomonoides_exilis_PA203 / gene_product=LMBR1 domain containing protein / transcript_product=LMBR1 domain containing protein / location=Mono_scaffold00497:23268-26095(-) / protein_length=614 / sequence_SO=supercontig / SO=protein_coding / is_pseudo=false
MLLFIAVLGLGLVDTPKQLWRRSNLKSQMNYHAFFIAKRYDEIQKQKESLTAACKKVEAIVADYNEDSFAGVYLADLQEEYEACSEYCELGANQLRNVNHNLHLSHDISKKVDKHQKRRERKLGGKDFAKLDEEIDEVSIKDLVSLRGAMLKARRALAKAKHDYFRHVSAYDEILKYQKGNEGKFTTKLLNFFKYSPLSLILLKSLSILSILLGLLIVWGEATMFINTIDLSPLSLLLHIEAFGSLQELLVFLLMCYLAFCSLSMLVRLRLFNYYHLVPGLSDPPSLFFFACYSSMLIAPLCQNVLVFLHANTCNADWCKIQSENPASSFVSSSFVSSFVSLLNSSSSSSNFSLSSSSSSSEDTPLTVYASVVSVMKVAPLVGNGFVAYFPIAIIVVVALAAFNVVDRILSCFRIKRFGVDSEVDEELTRKGKALAAEASAVMLMRRAEEGGGGRGGGRGEGEGEGRVGRVMQEMGVDEHVGKGVNTRGGGSGMMMMNNLEEEEEGGGGGGGGGGRGDWSTEFQDATDGTTWHYSADNGGVSYISKGNKDLFSSSSASATPSVFKQTQPDLSMSSSSSSNSSSSSSFNSSSEMDTNKSQSSQSANTPTPPLVFF